MSKKWYVVWVGTEPGICETWEECQIRTQGYPGARYKAFDSSREAIEAYRKDLDAHADPRAVIRAIAHAETSRTNYANIKEIYPGSVAVCGSCDHTTGMMQYRGVDVWSGTELFRFGPVAGIAAKAAGRQPDGGVFRQPQRQRDCAFGLCEDLVCNIFSKW